MAGNTDALRESYERFSAGDLDLALDLWTDKFGWDGTGSGLPESGQHEGKQATIEVLQQAVGAPDKFELSAGESVEQGDTFVVFSHQELAKDDRSARTPVVHSRCYRGDHICRLQLMTDTLEKRRTSRPPLTVHALRLRLNEAGTR